MSQAATADLREIGEYGEVQFGLASADAYQLNFDFAFERLADYPRIGEAKPGWGSGFRCYICNQHRVINRVQGAIVEIYRILHHSRDVSRHLPK